MTALDPQRTTGQPAVEPGPNCLCDHLEAVHDISTKGTTRFRARCSRSGCGCTLYRPAPRMVAVGPDVRAFLAAPAGCRVIVLDREGRRRPVAGVWYDAGRNEVVVDLARGAAVRLLEDGDG